METYGTKFRSAAVIKDSLDMIHDGVMARAGTNVAGWDNDVEEFRVICPRNIKVDC